MKSKLFCLLSALLVPLVLTAAAPDGDAVKDICQLNTTTVEVVYTDGHRLTLDFYGNNIFRMFQDKDGGILRDPAASPPARMLVDNPRKSVDKLKVSATDADVSVSTGVLRVAVSRKEGLLRVTDLRSGKVAVAESQPVTFKHNKYTVSFRAQPDEYFYGGGVQNGRFWLT
jgi:ABC-type uncharacterized transport system permease subunit